MSKRILIVEDDGAIQDLLRLALKHKGYEAVVACDGLEALEKMQTMTPDLILLDLAMPRMDGFRFVEELDLRGMRSSIPIIVLSAYGKMEDITHMHVDAFMAKPYRMAQLLKTISQLLNLSSPLERASHL